MFNDFIKIGCKLSFDSDNKKNISCLPKDWLNSDVSIFNNEPNFMIICGKINNITVIDLDFPKHNEVSSIDWFESKFGKISQLNTLVTSTVNNGFHIYFSYNNSLKTTTKFNNIPLDILNDKKGVLEGNGYNIINNNPIRSLTDSELLHFLIPQKQSDNLEMSISSYSKNFITRVLDGLSITRFDNYDEWLRIGFFLSQFNFGKELFDFYSEKSIKYNKTSNDSRWESFLVTKCDNNISLATMMFWLKSDNPDLFSIINKESKIIAEINNITKHENIKANEIICIDRSNIDLLCDYEKALIPLHDITSKKCSNCQMQGYISSDGFVLKCKNCSFFYPNMPIPIDKCQSPTIYNILNQVNIYEDIKNKDTLQVCNYFLNKWEESVFYDESNRRWIVYNETNGIYSMKTDNNIIKKIDDTVEESKENGEKEMFFEWTQKIEYKNQLLKEIKTKCEFPEHIEIDNFYDLVGFQNGVYDLNTMEFRKGKKDEFITMKCKYSYDIDTDTSIGEKLLSDYFSSQEEYEYVLDLLTLCLEGANRYQQFTICYGFSACNGKSFLMERLTNCFNDYGNTFSVNMLTGKSREAGSSYVELINFNKKRFMYCSEPEANSKFNANSLKQFTGDTVTARKNHSNEIERIKPTYNIFVCCNRLPEMDLYDGGISRRINIIEFKNKFTLNPNIKIKTEKQLIKYSEQEQKKIENSLLHLLIKNYQILKNKAFEIKEPEYLKILKESYGDSNNNIKDILEEYFEYSDSTEDIVYKKDIKKILKENNIKKIMDVDLERLVESIFACEYHNKKMIKTITYNKFFTGLKTIHDNS
jgi:P4 family phage/plasmid primase-like protien